MAILWSTLKDFVLIVLELVTWKVWTLVLPERIADCAIPVKFFKYAYKETVLVEPFMRFTICLCLLKASYPLLLPTIYNLESTFSRE